MYLATKNMAIAIVALLIFILAMQLIQNNFIVADTFTNQKKEMFGVINGPPVAACDSLTQPTLQMYPLNDSKSSASMRSPSTLDETLMGAFSPLV
jgi:hypothetical protein